MSQNRTKWCNWITEIQAIAQNGLAYSHNEFDKERYLRLRDIASELAANCAQVDLNQVKQLFSIESGYATPKLDVRSFVLKGDKVLMVKERSDGLWTLPGGWADVNESPSEAAIRETKEETGFDVSVVKLLALWDKLKHDHPPHWPHTYKCFFYCQIEGGEIMDNIEISDIDFFDLNSLPNLSLHRVTASQVIRLYHLIQSNNETLYD